MSLRETTLKSENPAQHLRDRPHCDLPQLEALRVLVLLGGIPLHGQERGNIEVFRSISELRLRAKFITNRRWGHLSVQPELTRLGFEWTTAKFGPLIGWNLLGLDFLRTVVGVLNTNWVLLREVRQWRPTHLHVMNWLYVLYASPLIFLLRIPLIYRLGDVPPESTFLHKWLWRLICRRAACIVCNSQFIKRELNRSGGQTRRARIIYSSTPIRDQSVEHATHKELPEATYLLYTGQISMEKGIPILVDAVRRCLADGCDIVLQLAGDYTWRNPMTEALLAKLKQDGLDQRIQFLGYRDDIPYLLRSSDVHVCPSVCSEAFANAVLEAKAEGIPSIVFPDGGLPEMIEHTVDGFICADKTVEALVEGICWFLDHPEERKGAGEAARRSLKQKFGPERFQRQWASALLDTWKPQSVSHRQ
jgi:glycosyltransferase involved in cell wall biosynthesis